VFCALHDQLASLGRHAQLTRCFSAVAELLVYGGLRKQMHTETTPVETVTATKAAKTTTTPGETTSVNYYPGYYSSGNNGL